MNTKTTIAIFAAVVMLGAAIAPSFVTSVSAQGGGITKQCTNPSGNPVNGQCNGQALEEKNVNPSGFAPPGQNK